MIEDIMEGIIGVCLIGISLTVWLMGTYAFRMSIKERRNNQNEKN